MQNIQRQLKAKLSKLYDEIKAELNFDLTLKDLVSKREVWKTDIINYLRRACRHLLTADVYQLSQTEQVDQLLQAELMIRHLIESLQAELTEFVSPEIDDEMDAQIAWDAVSQEMQYCPFTRHGDDVKVIVDHQSETNFFADISDDLESGGVFVATYDVLSVGKDLNVRLVIPGSGLFRLEGTVSWIRDVDTCADGNISPGMGISFKKMHPAPMRAIEQFMTEREPLYFEMA